MDIVSLNELKVGPRSPLIKEFRDLKPLIIAVVFILTCFFSETYPVLKNMQPTPVNNSRGRWAFTGSFSPWSLISLPLIFSPVGTPSSASLPRSWDNGVCRQREQIFFLLYILPVNANKRPALQELSYLQTPQGVWHKSIWPKPIKYKFTWYKHRMTAEISPPTSALHSVHTNDSGNSTNY